jgi:regulator of sigma E protease
MIDFVQTALSYIIPAFLVLTLVVTVHEFGHFLAARLCGVKVDRFSIGFGRALLSRTDKRGVEWRFGWIPLGGYVRFAGDESSASVPDHEDLKLLREDVVAREGQGALSQYFHFKPVWQRAIVVAAGPAANFLLAILLFAILAMWVGRVIEPAHVATVIPESPAARAGFQPNDVIVEVNGRTLKNFGELQQHVALNADLPVTFLVRRGDRDVVLNATPEPKRVKDQLGVYNRIGTLGITHDERRAERRRVRAGPVEAVGIGVGETWNVLSTTVRYLGRVVTGQVKPDQLGGPLRIGHTAGGLTKLSTAGATTPGEWLFGATVGLLTLSALLSVSIGFMNLLPVPVLDGGHLVFYAYEAVARRPVAAKVQDAGYRLGLALLLGLMLFATWNDFQNLRVFQLLGGLVS